MCYIVVPLWNVQNWKTLHNFLEVLEFDKCGFYNIWKICQQRYSTWTIAFYNFRKKLLTENKTEQFNIYNKYKKNAETNAFDTLALYLPNKIKI